MVKLSKKIKEKSMGYKLFLLNAIDFQRFASVLAL